MKQILTIFFLLTLLSLNIIIAQDTCSEDLCALNNTEENYTDIEFSNETNVFLDEEVEEEIICDNFKWVENYIQKELEEENASREKIQLVDVLKNANYNLQNDLNECESRPKRYLYCFWAMLITLILSWLYYWFRLKKQ